MADKKKILLRISPELWEHLNRWAADDLRSLNAQIEYLLREAVRRRRGERDTNPPPRTAERDGAPGGQEAVEPEQDQGQGENGV